MLNSSILQAQFEPKKQFVNIKREPTGYQRPEVTKFMVRDQRLQNRGYKIYSQV